MRRHALALVALPLFAGCLAAPEPEDLLAVGFRRPEQTFRTFQTALRADLHDLEYRCLSAGFKARQEPRITQIGWREFREQLFRERRWLKLVAWAEILEVIELGDGRRRIVAHVNTLFVDETFAVDFAQEDFYESFDEEGLAADGFSPWAEIAIEEEGRLVVTMPMPAGLTVDEIIEIRAGKEWKIDSFPVQLAP